MVAAKDCPGQKMVCSELMEELLSLSYVGYSCGRAICKTDGVFLTLRHFEKMESRTFLSKSCKFLPDICQLSLRKRANKG